MGTYDTCGGAPISPPSDEPYISPLQEKIWEILEDAGIHQSFIERIDKIIEEAECDMACAAEECRRDGE